MYQSSDTNVLLVDSRW